MSYSGENNLFSFRDGYCETLPGIILSTSDAAEFGRVISHFFKRFSVACDGFCHNYILYAICSGISECGHDVYVCENTDLPSFRFAFPLLSADCGIYISGSGCIRFSFFGENGFPMNNRILSGIMNESPAPPAQKSGKMIQATSFRDIYISNIADSLGEVCTNIPAGISCGSRSVRSLWLEFFSGEDDDLVFQISDDGRRVNAYSSEAGFISYEKLILNYAVKLIDMGQVVYLPDNFHYAADFLNDENSKKILRFSLEDDIPAEASAQRFLTDPLYMCLHLASDRKNFIETVKNLPQMAAAKREIVIENTDKIPFGKPIKGSGGRVIITQSGKKRITLLAQAYSSETAAELCSFWTDKLRRQNSCGGTK